MSQLIYLASPYSHDDPFVRRDRYLKARATLHWLLSQSLWTYSPIVHCHDLAIAHSLPKDANFWKEYNQVMFDKCDSMAVLKIPGWDFSHGVALEISWAEAFNKKIRYIDCIPADIGSKHTFSFSS